MRAARYAAGGLVIALAMLTALHMVDKVAAGVTAMQAGVLP